MPEDGAHEVDLRSAFKQAFGGGITGASAMAFQVTSLMWLRTTVNYQYRYGGSTLPTLKRLYKEGGVRRFYRGFLPALALGPIARFGDTAANAGVMALCTTPDGPRVPLLVSTFGASAAAALWRSLLLPLDALKTSMQVDGSKGRENLLRKVRTSGVLVLFRGGLAAMSANLFHHYPWYLTWNVLNLKLPTPAAGDRVKTLSRSAFIGMCASAAGDTSANFLRVLKTNRQTNTEKLSYVNAAKGIVEKDGLVGLFGRGLKTRLLANCFQGACFAVLWRLFQDAYWDYKRTQE